jgi:hypothetical protein
MAMTAPGAARRRSLTADSSWSREGVTRRQPATVSASTITTRTPEADSLMRGR